MKKIYSFLNKTILLSAFVLGCLSFTNAQNEVDVSYESGTFDAENSWQLVDVNAGIVTPGAFQNSNQLPNFGDNPYTITTPTTVGNVHDVRVWDNFGDTWNGASIDVSYNGESLIGGPIAVPDLWPFGSITGECDPCDQVADLESTGGRILASFVPIEILCELDCPDNIVVNADPGECSAFVDVPQPGVAEECVGAPEDCSSATSGQVELNHDGFALLPTDFEVTGVSAIPSSATCVVSVPVTISVAGDFGPEADESTEILDEDGNVFTSTPTTEGICGSASVVINVPVATYNGWAADGVIEFELLGNVNVGDFCATSFIQASVEWCEACGPDLVNDFNGTDDASGEYPVGETTVVFVSYSPGGLATECEFTVTVVDNQPPSIVCPGDQTINLDAGECGVVYNFDISVSDNCPLDVSGDFSVFGDIQNCAGTGASLGCGLPSGQIQELDISALPAGTQITEGCFVFDNQSWGQTIATVNFYVAPSNAAIYPSHVNATPVSTSGAVAFAPASSGTAVCVDVPDFPVPVGMGLYMEVYSTFGNLVYNGNGSGALCNGVALDGTNTWFASLFCQTGQGVANPGGLYADLGFAGYDAFFAYKAELELGGLPDANNEYTSGDLLPIGEHCFTFSIEDIAELTDECTWCVTVNEYPEDLQTGTLACNDNVNISVDEACEVTFGADMFLEGGPYGCYDNYSVRIVPFGDMNSDFDEDGIEVNGVTLDFSTLLGQHVYQVSDDTGNSCWGFFNIEDKIAPTIECEEIEIACTTNPAPGDDLVGEASGSSEDQLNWGDGDTGLVAVATANTSGAAPGAVVSGLEVEIQMDHSWVGDLDIDLEAPDGTVVRLLDSQCSINDNINATFSDDGDNVPCSGVTTAAGHENCPQNYSSATVNGFVAPNGSFADFNGASANGTWTLYVRDNVGGDGGCLSTFNLDVEWTVYAPAEPTVADNCGTLDPTYTDVVIEGGCNDEYASVIERTWTVDDASGNGPVSCVQIINVTRETLSSLTVPPDFDGLDGNEDILACDGNWPALSNGYPAPLALNQGGTGFPGGVGSCGTISWTYEDILLPICNGVDDCLDCSASEVSYKLLRNWIIVDWCTGDILEYPQIIKVMDLDAPEFDTEQADITISTDIWGCAATLNLSDLDYAVSDNCSDFHVSYSSSAGSLVGPTCDPTSIVFDDPAVCQGPVTVTITATDCCGNTRSDDFLVYIQDQVPPVVVADHHTVVTLSADGTAKIYAETFDDGSHDGCGPIGMSVKRMDDGGDCAFQSYFPGPSDDNAEYNEIVHFCCADIGEVVMVQFQVCDDADCSGTPGDTNGDNCNVAMVEVEVQDKLTPVVVCPPNMTINCIDYAALGDVSELSDDELNSLFGGSATAYATCDVDLIQFVSIQEEICGEGQFSRIFQVPGTNATCVQTIFVEASPNGDNLLECEDITFPAGSAEANTGYDWCESASNNGPEQSFPPVVVGSADCGGFEPTAPEINIDDLCTEVGINVTIDTFAFAGGGCFKYLVHWEVIDQCLFQENYVDPITGETDPFVTDNGYFHIYVEYDVFDTEGPTVLCQDDILIGCNEGAYVGVITGAATDNCTPEGFFGWNWKLDAFNDFSIDLEGQGQSVAGTFPVGTHRLIWIVSDGCGNTTTEECIFSVSEEDNKAPTPYCYDGLSTAIMQPEACSVTLWAEDFNAGSFDDCGPVWTSIVPEQDIPEGASAEEAYELSLNEINGVYGWEFDCDYIENGVTAVIEVRMYATDQNGNYDYCVASLRLDDNFDCCEDQGGSKEIGGEISTEAGEPVEGATVEANSIHSEYPQYQVTDENGTYAFYNAPQYYDFDITSDLDEEYLNGVTTLDLVLIQKHILSIQTLDSPYQLIAADINSDCNVTANDLLELRKLILGLYAGDDLPNNTSWRFVESAYQFQDPSNPCPFDETIDIDNLTQSQMNENFVGVKIGDVNGTAVANATMDAETRNANALTLTVNEATVEAGEEFAIEFTSADFDEVSGYQFTLGFNNAEFVGVEAGALSMSEANFGLNRIDEGMITTSWGTVNPVSVEADAVLFTVHFKATSNGTISEIVSLSSRITPAEAYQGSTLDVYEVNLEFRTENGVVSDEAFALYQNEPNPFNGNTIIGFNLPASANATLTVYDVTGKVVHIVRGDYAKGMNTVALNSNLFSTSGVLYYQLESGEYTATKKMIVLE